MLATDATPPAKRLRTNEQSPNSYADSSQSCWMANSIHSPFLRTVSVSPIARTVSVPSVVSPIARTVSVHHEKSPSTATTVKIDRSLSAANANPREPSAQIPSTSLERICAIACASLQNNQLTEALLEGLITRAFTVIHKGRAGAHYNCENTRWPLSITVVQNYIFLHKHRIGEGAYNCVDEGVVLRCSDRIQMLSLHVLRSLKNPKRNPQYQHPDLQLHHPNLGTFVLAKVNTEDLKASIVPNFGIDSITYRPIHEDIVKLAYVAKQSASGLCHMHLQGYVHCDIRPDNICINESLHTSIIDFDETYKVGDQFTIRINPDFLPTEYRPWMQAKADPLFDRFAFGKTVQFWLRKFAKERITCTSERFISADEKNALLRELTAPEDKDLVERLYRYSMALINPNSSEDTLQEMADLLPTFQEPEVSDDEFLNPTVGEKRSHHLSNI